jgi:hypothetical protein
MHRFPANERGGLPSVLLVFQTLPPGCFGDVVIINPTAGAGFLRFDD